MNASKAWERMVEESIADAACWKQEARDLRAKLAASEASRAELVGACNRLLADKYLLQPINDDRMDPVRAALANARATMEGMAEG